tara:strand:- start:758 stop:1189 length:432 start_codon:yes stop_codon:yes gene_type:complete
MANDTHRGITVTTSGSATINIDYDLPLQAGVDQDDTTWLTDYPGGAGTPANALAPFSARQTDGANRMQPRLLCLTLGNLAEAETITFSGGVNVILSVIAHGSDATANLGVAKTAALELTADCEATTDGTTNDTSNATIWVLVA